MITDDVPEDKVYTFNAVIVTDALAILKLLVKPRHEENNEVVAKLETKLIYEIDNIDIPMFSAQDGEDCLHE